ncbi:hypothetical protein F442_02406 [Phytophthora nicotianae P10297]|uniref:Uncharacterized protein n=1 Tax=Phytophthora nicotianae P10297 TaxID=1317064 RepID=W3A239_PHYNI|nr:hypothetical protein F442_02406 [Phytophthora nicotianae P10297]
MRTPCALLLLVTLVAVIDIASALKKATISKVTARNLLSLTGPNDDTTPDESFLQNSGAAHSESATNTEYRIAIPGLSNIAKLASDFSPLTQKVAFQLWLQQQTSPTIVFNLLHAKMLKNMGTNLEKNTELLDWLRYTMAYREMLGSSKFYTDGKIYLHLLNLAPETSLAFFFQSLRKTADLKMVGENLQTAQYKLWWKLRMEPSDLAKSLGITELLESGKVMSDPRFIIYFGYAEVWLRKIKLN